jgi:hypothetical protein
MFVSVVKRTLLAGAVLVGNGVVPINPEALRGFYLSVYPSDPGKSQALELCFLQDPQFNRLDANQRDTCYRHALVTAQDQSGPAPVEPVKANPVDLRRDAAAGSMPRNDVRRLEQTENIRHSPP